MSAVELTDRVAIVTGAGRGLGRSHALALSRRGAAVIVNDLSREHADEVVAEIVAEGGRAAAAYDSITEPKNCLGIVDFALDSFGSVDVVVNNAGFLRNGDFEEQTPDTFAAMVDVHVSGAFFLTQAAWPLMRAKGYGRVVMTSSAGGMFAMGGQANYAAAKAGVYGLMKALAFEGKAHGIKVNAVLPHGNTDIRFHDAAIEADPVRAAAEARWASQHGGNFAPGVMESLRAVRLTEAVSPFVTFLSSAACELTGEAFAVGCGRFARVFVGETLGWTAPDPGAIDPDDIVANLDAVRSPVGYQIPENLYEEMKLMAVATGRWAPSN